VCIRDFCFPHLFQQGESRFVIESVPNPGDSAQENESWKNEVASRLDRYRSKSQRKLTGEFSMRFNFDGEPARPRQQVCVPSPQPKIAAEIPEIAEAISETAAALPQETKAQIIEEKEEPELVELPQTVPPSQPPPLRPSVPFKRRIVMEANVIEFPRLFPPEPPASNLLAEPMVATVPRILDAPEIARPLLETPILDGMRLEHLDHNPAPELELPLQVAPLARRLYASTFDGLIVLLASGVFSGISYKILSGIEWTMPVVGVMASAPAILWGMYQYLFIVYGARTPGMAAAQLAFSTFEGTAPNLRQRRVRMLAMALSCSSLMLGFLWAFFDEDMLCWHDRISRTYTFRQKS
jgi:uncharacterized RDD family membrane protein YckC